MVHTGLELQTFRYSADLIAKIPSTPPGGGDINTKFARASVDMLEGATECATEKIRVLGQLRERYPGTVAQTIDWCDAKEKEMGLVQAGNGK